MWNPPVALTSEEQKIVAYTRKAAPIHASPAIAQQCGLYA